MGHEPSEATVRGLRDVMLALRGIRRRARLLLVVRRVALIVTITVLVGLVLGLMDYAFRLPRPLRIAHWFAGAGIVLFAMWRYLLPALRFCPDLTDLALRIEEREPRLAGLLASAVDFVEHGDGSRSRNEGLSAGLVDIVLARAREIWPKISVQHVLDRGGVLQATSFLALAIAATAIVYAMSSVNWAIGAERQAWPFGDASWPKRTGVIDVTTVEVHPRGTAIPLQAEVTRHNRPLSDMNVAVRYRYVGGEGSTEARRELLTWQGRHADEDATDRGTLFERLVETTGTALEYRFETDDDETPWRTITLVEPPSIVGAKARLVPPAYALAAEPSEQMAWTREAEVDMGPGTDERAVAPSALQGSRVELTIDLVKPVEMPPSLQLAVTDIDPDASLTQEGSAWSIAWDLEASTRLPIRLVDEYGIESVDDATYRFEAIVDRQAEATMTLPVTDQNVLPTAVVDLAAEGRDDVGLTWVGIERAIARPVEAAPGSEPSGPGGALEPVGEPVMVSRLEGEGRRQVEIAEQLDLSVMGLKPGDEVYVTAIAADIHRLPGTRESRSVVRTFRIISDEQFISDVQRLFNDVRESAMRIEQQQAEVQTATSVRGATRESRRGQAQVTTRLDRQRESLEEIERRIKQNGLNDAEIEDMLRSAQASLARAGEASSSASRRLDEAAADARRGPSAGQQESGEQGQQGDSLQSGEQGQQGDSSRSGEQGQQGDSSQSGEQGQQGDSSQSGEQGQQGDSSQSGEQGQQGDSSQSGEQGQQGDSSQSGEQGQQGDSSQTGERGQRDGEAPGTEVPIEEGEAQAIDQEQQDVRDELLDLVELLDRGEDSFVVRRKLENIAQAQEALREQTAQAAAQTAGRSVDELTPRERSEMERIVERQRELAQQMQDLVDEMQTREEALREADPAAAAGMAQAAARAQQQQTAQTMEQAAQEATENQMTNAGQQQEQAMRDLEQMMEDIEAGNRQRQEILQRMLASVLESIKGLIRVQKQELAALDEAEARGDFAGRDAAMIALSQNTLGVIDLVDAGGPELAPVSANVDRAYDAQVRAITALRKATVDVEAVRTHERGSLEMLERALEQGEEIQRQMQAEEQQRRFAELQQRYRDLLEQQIAIINETDPFAQLEQLSRRDRVQVRKLADRQDEVRLSMEEIRESTEEIRDAGIFDYAHDRADALMQQATTSLSEAEPASAAIKERLAARMIQSIIEALDDPEQEEDPFDQGQGNQAGGGAGGGSGEQPLIPPIKELMLLRQIQVTLSDATIEVENAGGDAALVDEIGEGQQKLFELAEDLLRRINEQPGGGMPGNFDLDDVGEPTDSPDDGSGGSDDASGSTEDPQQ